MNETPQKNSSKQLQTASSVFGENDQLVNALLVVVGIYLDTFLRVDLPLLL